MGYVCCVGFALLCALGECGRAMMVMVLLGLEKFARHDFLHERAQVVLAGFLRHFQPYHGAGAEFVGLDLHVAQHGDEEIAQRRALLEVAFWGDDDVVVFGMEAEMQALADAGDAKFRARRGLCRPRESELPDDDCALPGKGARRGAGGERKGGGEGGESMESVHRVSR